VKSLSKICFGCEPLGGVDSGNVDLDPVISDAFDLGYLKRWEKVTLSNSIYYNRGLKPDKYPISCKKNDKKNDKK